MNYSKILPATGAGGLVIGSFVISQSWLLAFAFAIVATAAYVVRQNWRSDKKINDL